MPANIKYTNCSLIYSESCIISEKEKKVQKGDTFYLLFFDSGLNHYSTAEI